jgi:hypothetical protein
MERGEKVDVDRHAQKGEPNGMIIMRDHSPGCEPGCGKPTVCGEVNLARGLSLWALSEFDAIMIHSRSMGGRIEDQSEPMLRRRLTFMTVTSNWDDNWVEHRRREDVCLRLTLGALARLRGD